MRKSKLTRSLRYLPILIVTLLLCACNDPVHTEYGDITGHISLVNDLPNPEDFRESTDGIEVRLYASSPADTTLLRLQSVYSDIGTGIDQTTEFDHRYAQPVVSTTTDETGSFSLNHVAEGVYNLVAVKPGWGWKYIYNVSIDSQHEITLYPETTVSGYNPGLLDLQSDHHYIFQGTTTLYDVNIGSNVWMRITPNGVINILGNCTKLTDAFCYVSPDTISIYQPSSVNFSSPSMSDFSHYVIRGLQNGLRFTGGTVNISHVRMIDCVQSMELDDGVYTMEYTTITSSQQTGQGLGIYNSTGTIRKNVFLGFNQSVSLRSISQVVYNDNFNRSVNCLDINTDAVAEIEYNRLEASALAILMDHPGVIKIRYNEIFGVNGLHIGSPVRTATNLINLNNISATEYHLYAHQSNPVYITYHLDCRNNFYYGITDASQLPEYIRDQTDYTNPNYNAYYIDYLPIKTVRVPQAGIRNNGKK